jgi:hypothetical protein
MRSDMAKPQSRDAISRARFFVQKAELCNVQQREECEAYLETAIIFGRTILHRLQSKYSKHPDWKRWWDGLLSNASVSFFRIERDWILKEGPPKVGQVICLSDSSNLMAVDLYYYESPNIRVTDTIRQHLDEMEKLELEARNLFS